MSDGKPYGSILQTTHVAAIHLTIAARCGWASVERTRNSAETLAAGYVSLLEEI